MQFINTLYGEWGIRSTVKKETIFHRLQERDITLHNVIYGKNNWTTRLHMQCNACHHTWDADLHGVMYGKKRGCPSCARKRIVAAATQKRKSNKDIDRELETRTTKRVGEYINNHTKIEWLCVTCNYTWFKTPSDIIHSHHGCPRCSKRERVTNEFIDTKLIETKRNIRRIGNSCGCMTKINWQCTDCSGMWSARPNDIFSTHKSGCPYCQRKNYSRMAIEWITYVEKTNNIHIQHAGNGGEFRIPGTRLYADGYCSDTNTIYEFHGNRFHGNPRMFEPTDKCHPYDPTLTAEQLYTNTLRREQRLASKGYSVVTIWEDEWVEQQSTS